MQDTSRGLTPSGVPQEHPTGGGTKRWAVIDAGTDFLGCDYVTAAVRKDLFGSALCP